MRSPRFLGLGLWGVFVPLLGSLGCTISITPAWHMPAMTPASSSYPYPGAPPIPIAGMPNPNLPPGAPNGPYPPNGPYSQQQPLPPITSRSASDYVSQLAERLQGAEDSRLALVNRLQSVEAALREKDQAVLQTSHEVQESTKQMRRTREELLRLKQELDDSREKNRATYREYKNTLDAFLKALEDNVDSGKSTPAFRGIGTSQIGEPPAR